MVDVGIPDLTFAMVKYGVQEIPVDLRILLYRGGAKSNSRKVLNQIATGALGSPLMERMALVKRIHEAMTARLVGGGSKYTFISSMKCLRMFFAWVDDFDQMLSFESVENIYLQWCDFLVNRHRLNSIKNNTAYSQGGQVSKILGEALERNIPLICGSHLRLKKRSALVVGVAADKQNLADNFAFGHLCLDIVDSLPFDAIYGALPVKIRFRNGLILEHWSGLKNPEQLVGLRIGYNNKKNTEMILQKRANWEAEHTLRTRFPLVNLRIVAELLIFIAQTGMNLSQAFHLRCSQYSYKSTIDGFEVRDYKKRRKGEVLFEIFSEYKQLFQSYLIWREKIFGTTSDRLFPLVRVYGAIESSAPDFKWFKEKICKPAGVPFIPPQQIRKFRINWLLRQSRNPDQTADQAQHTKETLLRVYEKPSLQVAQIEIIQFWQKNDPGISKDKMSCSALGVCNGEPKPLPNLPPEAPKPDCTQPSGCLFCEHHRDIDSADYVWSVATMRYLHTVILQRFRPPANIKGNVAQHVELVIDVLTAKLQWFNDSNATRKVWVEEATEKMAEGEFHAHWRYLIESTW